MTVRWMAALGLVIMVAAEQVARAVEWDVKGEDGQALATIVSCNDCQAGQSKKTCPEGAAQGWLNGKPCGQCLIDANLNAALRYPNDLHFTGTLTNPEGQPVKTRYVKLFIANGWSVRTRTSDAGTFRLMLGATTERRSKQPLITDLGTLVDSQKGNDPEFALFLLPAPYKPCAAGAAAPAKPPKGKKKP